MILNVVLLIIGFFTCGREFGAKNCLYKHYASTVSGAFEKDFPGFFYSMTDSQELDVLCYILVVASDLQFCSIEMPLLADWILWQRS